MKEQKRLQKEFGNILKKEREKRSLTQSNIAEQAVLDNSYISQIERGLVNPSLFTIYKIIKALDMPHADIRYFLKGLIQEKNNDESLGIYLQLENAHNQLIKSLSIILAVIELKLLSLENRVDLNLINDIHARLKSISLINNFILNKEEETQLQIYFNELFSSVLSSFAKKEEVLLDTEVNVKRITTEQVLTLGFLTNELLINSIKYSFSDDDSEGEIKVRISEYESEVIEYEYLVSRGGIDVSQFKKAESLEFGLVHSFMQELNAYKINVDSDEQFELSFLFELKK